MEQKHANFCKDILYEIHHNGPLEKVRMEWNKFQDRCLCQNLNVVENHESDKNISCEYSSSVKICEGYEDNARLILTANKLLVEIAQKVDENTITNYIQSGIFNFGINLFCGSVQQNLEVLVRVQEAALKESQNLGFTIPLSIYLKLSPRLQFTGAICKDKPGFNLALNSRVTLTSDRKYASRCCRKIIYVNAKFLIYDLKKCEVILLGNSVQLRVIESSHDSALCAVTAPGTVTSRMPVIFPPRFKWAQERVSAEELEDITFAVGTNINVIVTQTPGNETYCQQLRETLTEFHCDHFYLFTCLRLSNVECFENARRIAEMFDGFLIDCSGDQPKDKVVKLSLSARTFIEGSYKKKKPIFLRGCWTELVDSSDYQCAFYYPDKYVFPCSSNFLHVFEAVFNKSAPVNCTKKDFHDMSITGSTTMARSIAASSFDFNAEVIVICSIAGQMAKKISHFRPAAPIIAVTSLKSIINYTSMHHNIWMLLFDANKDTKVSHKKDTHQKLVYGVRYAVLKKLIDNNSNIILVYRKLLRFGYTDKFVVIRFDDGYVETIKNAILEK